MKRYFILPTLAVFLFGLAAGWSLRPGRSAPRDVWYDAHVWSKGFDDGLELRHVFVGPTPGIVWIPECGDAEGAANGRTWSP